MDLQEACEIADKLIEDDSDTKYPKLTMKQFAAINQILLEMQSTEKYTIKD